MQVQVYTLILAYQCLNWSHDLSCITNLWLQGFGVAAKSTQDCRRADPTTIIAFHQADIGQYIRTEDTLV